MNPTEVGALIGVGGATFVQGVAGLITIGREKQRLNETRLRELAQVVDGAAIALTGALRELASAGESAQEIGAASLAADDRWGAERVQAHDRLSVCLGELRTYSHLLRLRVAEDNSVLRGFEDALEAFARASSAVEELLEPFVDRARRAPSWEGLREALNVTTTAQREFEAAARELLGPRLQPIGRRRR